jgi:large subunit ribosomal protein L22
MITASLNNLRISPRKVRSVANLVRGKDAITALHTLTFVSKKGKHPLKGLLESALANAKQQNLEKEGLMIKELRVDVGQTLKRSMPRARGSAYPIHKRVSHVLMVLAPKVVKEKKAKAVKVK